MKRSQGQARTVKLAAESRYGKKITVDMDVMPWLLRHAGDVITRYQIGEDGKTAWQRVRGKVFRTAVVEFAEGVRYLKPMSKGRDKADSRWGEGVWLGIRDESGEHLIGTSEGVIKVRTIRRISEDSERWKWER